MSILFCASEVKGETFHKTGIERMQCHNAELSYANVTIRQLICSGILIQRVSLK
jgi:hypothetical protein